MHRKYRFGPGIRQTLSPASGRAAGIRRGRAGRGYSLLEMLVVIVIISMLLAASNVLFHSPASKAGEPAARMARCLGLARAQAVAANRKIAIRFDKQQPGSRELVMRFLCSQPGQSAAADVREFRRPERFEDIIISKDVVIPPNPRHPAATVADAPPARFLTDGEALVIDTDGQVLLGTGNQGFPAAADHLEPSIRLGIQAAIGGRVVAATSHDVAIVEIQCASGTSRVLQP